MYKDVQETFDVQQFWMQLYMIVEQIVDWLSVMEANLTIIILHAGVVCLCPMLHTTIFVNLDS